MFNRSFLPSSFPVIRYSHAIKLLLPSHNGSASFNDSLNLSINSEQGLRLVVETVFCVFHYKLQWQRQSLWIPVAIWQVRLCTLSGNLPQKHHDSSPHPSQMGYPIYYYYYKQKELNVMPIPRAGAQPHSGSPFAQFQSLGLLRGFHWNSWYLPSRPPAMRPRLIQMHCSLPASMNFLPLLINKSQAYLVFPQTWVGREAKIDSCLSLPFFSLTFPAPQMSPGSLSCSG